jgi:hypothetical protein
MRENDTGLAVFRIPDPSFLVTQAQPLCYTPSSEAVRFYNLKGYLMLFLPRR